MKSESNVHTSEAMLDRVDDCKGEIRELTREIVLELMECSIQELSFLKVEWIGFLKEQNFSQGIIAFCEKLVDAVAGCKEEHQCEIRKTLRGNVDEKRTIKEGDHQIYS